MYLDIFSIFPDKNPPSSSFLFHPTPPHPASFLLFTFKDLAQVTGLWSFPWSCHRRWGWVAARRGLTVTQNALYKCVKLSKNKFNKELFWKRHSYILFSPIQVKGIENRFPIFESPDVSAAIWKWTRASITLNLGLSISESKLLGKSVISPFWESIKSPNSFILTSSQIFPAQGHHLEPLMPRLPKKHT